MNKLEKLKKILKGMNSALVAYSGGLDSTFLLRVAKEVLRDNVLAVTADSATYPHEELVFAKRMAHILKVRHKIIKTQELKDRRFISNSIERCYFCKRELFSRLKEIARENKIRYVLDATNLSDEKDFRPGNKARKELGIRSPLQEVRFSKDGIRFWSKKLGLPTWNKPPSVCLASRVPYGLPISKTTLKKINQAERVLKKMGFNQVRVRHYNDLCRIEVPRAKIPLIIKRADVLVKRLKRLGYCYVTLDLQGYRSGSLNEVLKRKSF
ncbi:MAG: ATP-dependent sacrificial sulfur transferase LarE [Candidatus Omnitrophica bacterium]|nr:ATP-dependent sacrificial sulfur transferase LarE [Candidatus Omnitrophota bacterium]